MNLDDIQDPKMREFVREMQATAADLGEEYLGDIDALMSSVGLAPTPAFNLALPVLSQVLGNLIGLGIHTRPQSTTRCTRADVMAVLDGAVAIAIADQDTIDSMIDRLTERPCIKDAYPDEDDAHDFVTATVSLLGAAINVVTLARTEDCSRAEALGKGRALAVFVAEGIMRFGAMMLDQAQIKRDVAAAVDDALNMFKPPPAPAAE